jgi:hypothetical protein
VKLAAAAVFLAIAAQDAKPPAEPDWVELLPPRKAIAGLAGFHSTSRLVYAEAPEREHVLETTYVFPGRVRWYLALVDGEPGDRVIEYRCGDAYFAFHQGVAESVPVPLLESEAPVGRWTDHVAAQCNAMELRRALFTWPDGFDWRGEGDVRVATTTCRSHAAEFLAVLDGDGRPTEMRSEPVWRYENIRWREARGRWWPASVELVARVDPDTGDRRESRVWTETVDSVETSIHLLDEFFVPPDRRKSTSAARAASEIAPLDFTATAVSRSALAGGAEWTAALARAKSWRSDARERAAKAKREIEPALLIELDASGDPCAVLARLVGDGALPEGFAAAPARRALTRWIPFEPSAIESVLAELRARLPADSRALAAYVRVPSPDAPDPLAQIVLPFEPPP